jgi:hypothetical protein
LRAGLGIGVVLVLLVVLGTLGDAQDRSFSNSPHKDYLRWAMVTNTLVFSPLHGNVFVFTYVNPIGLTAAKGGKFPFPVGTVIVKRSYANSECTPGRPLAVFVMEKRAPGYDPKANDWHWARYEPDGSLWAEGKSGSQVDFCVACHSVAKVNDFVFGNGTSIKAIATIPLAPCKAG